MAYKQSTTNICNYCKHSNSDGIIRNSKFYCTEKCFTQSRRPSHIKTPINKICNYCYATFDININPGILHGPYWFCSNSHLISAYPRQKIIIAQPGYIGHPIGLMGPIIVYRHPF
jgi:hypothetical protein